LKNKRFLVKLSGEILKNNDSNISWELADNFCKKITPIIKEGIELGFVIGGGNIFRGASGSINNYNRTIGDQVGMLATSINGLILAERFKAHGIPAIIQSGIEIKGIASLFNRDKIEETFTKGGTILFTGGIGNPYFSTDTTSVLRALQIEASYVIKATKVDGIYDKDPILFPDAKKYNILTFDEIIEKRLKVMDLTAILLMKENKMKLMVFNMDDINLLKKACKGEKIGTIVEK